MTYTAMNLVSSGFPISDVHFTYGLNASIDVVNDLGKALALDPTAANTMKLAGTGDRIIGLLVTAEDRGSLGKVGTVARQFKEQMPAPVGHTIVVGDSVTGINATPGLVQTRTDGATPPNKVYDHTVVIEVGTNFVVVEKL